MPSPLVGTRQVRAGDRQCASSVVAEYQHVEIVAVAERNRPAPPTGTSAYTLIVPERTGGKGTENPGYGFCEPCSTTVEGTMAGVGG